MFWWVVRVENTDSSLKQLALFCILKLIPTTETAAQAVFPTEEKVPIGGLTVLDHVLCTVKLFEPFVQLSVHLSLHQCRGQLTSLSCEND